MGLRFALRALMIAATCTVCTAANSMDVLQTTWRGRSALLLQGPVERGDADKIEEGLRGILTWQHGATVVLLNSPGGLVGEALKVSKVFDRYPVHTVIPQGAKCASACASIIFIAGRYRTIEGDGLFGQHSCSIDGRKDQGCNRIISEHAFEHGVSYGSVAAFVTYIPPKDISWMSRSEADCFGLTRYPFERESGFEKSEPCVIEAIGGLSQGAQSAWRVDFKADGYRAFQRTIQDNKRELELSLFCMEAKRGSLFLSMDIEGPDNVIRQAVVGASLAVEPLNYPSMKFDLVNTNEGYTQLVVEIPPRDVATFLQKPNKLVFTARVRKPFTDMVATTYMSNSRKALLFAANNCIRGGNS